MTEPNWIALESSNLEAATYNPVEEILSVKFTSGTTYNYFGVPQEIATGLFEAESAGRYFNSNIRYLQYEKQDDTPEEEE